MMLLKRLLVFSLLSFFFNPTATAAVIPAPTPDDSLGLPEDVLWPPIPAPTEQPPVIRPDQTPQPDPPIPEGQRMEDAIPDTHK